MQPQAIIYCRVSTGKQAKEGNGLSGQERRCRQCCSERGYHLLKVFKDAGVSGKDLERPALNELLLYLEKRNDATIVIVDEPKRLARDIGVYLKLKDAVKRNGGRLENTTGVFDESPEGELIENFTVMVGQLERQQNVRQVKNRMRSRTEEGYYSYGRVQIGYKPGTIRGVREPDPASAASIKQGLEGYAAEVINNFEDLARFLNNRKIVDYKGSPSRFDGDRAKLLLKKAWYYAGFVECEKAGVSRRVGQHKALVSPDILNRIERRLSGKPLPKYNKGQEGNFPLRGYIYCSGCGRRMTAADSGGRANKYGYYSCKNGDCLLCHKGFRVEDVHHAFLELVKEIQPLPEMVDLAVAMLKEEWARQREDVTSQQCQYASEIVQLDKEIPKLVHQLADVNSAAVKKAICDRIEELSTRRTNLQFLAQNLPMGRDDFQEVLSSVEDVLLRPATLWEQSGLALKQVIQDFVFPRGITLETDKKFRKPEKGLPYAFIEKFKAGKPVMVAQSLRD